MSRPAMRQACHRILRPSQAGQLRFSSRYSQPGQRRVISASASPSGAYYEAPLSVPSAGPLPISTPQQANPYHKDDALAWEVERAKALRRIRFASTGLFFSALGLGIVSYLLLDAMEEDNRKKSGLQLDAPESSNVKFQGRDVRVIGAGEDKRIVAAGPQDTDLVETGTSSVPYFPKVLYLPNSTGGSAATPNSAANPGNLRNDEEYSLIGLGIRTVSFLSIQVYVMGLYVRTTDLSALQTKLIKYVNETASTLVPSEKEDLRSALLDPVKSTEVWERLLADTNVKSAWRISPTRNTDFAHLRDGWITGINKGTQAAKAAIQAKSTGPVETEYESESFGQSVKAFRDIFTKGGKAQKGSTMTLVMNEKGALDVIFEDPSKNEEQEKLGHIADARVGRLIWMGYLAGKNVSSEAARKGVAEGCLVLASRPVGSAETMVT